MFLFQLSEENSFPLLIFNNRTDSDLVFMLLDYDLHNPRGLLAECKEFGGFQLDIEVVGHVDAK